MEKVKGFWQRHRDGIKNVAKVSLSIAALTFGGVTGLKEVLGEEVNEIVMV